MATFSWSQNVFIKQDGYADTTKGFPLEDTAGSFLQDAKASFYQEACLLALWTYRYHEAGLLQYAW